MCCCKARARYSTPTLDSLRERRRRFSSNDDYCELCSVIQRYSTHLQLTTPRTADSVSLPPFLVVVIASLCTCLDFFFGQCPRRGHAIGQRAALPSLRRRSLFQKRGIGRNSKPTKKEPELASAREISNSPLISRPSQKVGTRAQDAKQG